MKMENLGTNEHCKNIHLKQKYERNNNIHIEYQYWSFNEEPYVKSSFKKNIQIT